LQGIHIEGSSIDTVRIEGNYIGTDVSGTVDVGNKQNGIYVLDAKNTLIRDSVVLGNDLSGIVISGGSNHTLEHNVVSGNGVDGIQMLGTTDSLVGQNTIGLNANRSAVAANTRYGLYVSGSMRNTIDRNYASGNHFGINVFSSSDCTLTGNVVGLLGDGYTVARNEYFGIFIDRSHRTRVGTNGDGVQDAQERNVVTGQWKNIFVENSQDTVVAGNFVGTSVTGVLPSVVVPDTTGVHVRSSERTRVGTDGSNDNNNSNERNVLTGNSKGVWVELSAIDTVIAGNFIGISSEGMQLSYGNTMGIYVDNGPINTRIGSDINGVRDAEERNIISGNEYGVHIYGTTTTGTWIRSNYIGSSVSGTVAIANGIGVYLDRAGSTSMVNNVISGNGSAVVGGSSRDISLTGNLIGTAPDGLAMLANGQGLSFNASGSITIGGTTTEARNIIANSAGSGISLGSMEGSLGATMVQGNYIGVDASGTTAAGNALGIHVIDSPGVTIGGGISEARNVVSGNNQGGIAIVGDKSTNITVAGNYVGTNAAGTVAVGNKHFGIFIGDGDLIGITNTTSAKGVTIGGTTVAERNIISGNTGTGLQIGGSGADDNIVIGNYIGLASDGQTAIANNGIGISVYQGAKRTRIGTDADGQNDSREGNVISGNSAGGIVIGGNGTEDSVIAGNFVGTDSNGNTAIENRNSGVWIFNGAKNNLVGGSTAASRNVISGNRLAGVAVESVGTTGNVIRGNWIGTNATGTAAIPNLEAGVGLINGSSGTSVLNNVVSGNRTMGIGLGAFGGLTEGSHNNLIFGNLVGTDPSGMVALPNQGVGIVLRDKSSGNTVGGTTAAERNIISANTTGGIQLLHSNTSNNVILGNYVGIGADGNLPLGNGAAGILVSSGASGNTIGGTAAGTGNTISANLTHGIHISGTTTSTTTVQGNQVGINAPGTLDRGNAFFGLFIEDSGGHTIGGNASGAGNVISGNDRGGVAIIGGSSTNVTVAGNLIGTNAAGMAAIGNGAFGVLIGSGPIVGQPNTGTARNNTVGGSATGSGNTISGNGGPGVWIASGGAAGNNVAGNLIGTDKLGVQAIGNQTGVLLSLGAQDNVIGGAAANSRNIISGNIGSGVRIIDANSSGNSILNNWIGLNATGDVPLANTLYGIEIAQGASANQLLDNLVSGNNLGGIKLGDTTTGNTLARNRVGLNSGGTLAIGNGAEGLGIWITNATDNMIGGESATLGNFIVGNQGDGIRISGNSTLNRIEGNDFGLTNSPTSLGNGRHGIVLDGVDVKNNTI
jgi:parallel beta-helix repeat protein